MKENNFNAELKVTFNCNNNCRFCLNSNRKGCPDLSTETLRKKILAAVKKKCSLLAFTGGEPTLRKDFFEICKSARLNGLDVEIQSNGRLFYYKTFVNKISGLNINRFLISIHGHNKNLHDFLTRSPDSFSQTVKGIKKLKRKNNFVITNTVINKYNFRYLREIVLFLSKLNVDQIQLTWPESLGEVKDNFNELVPKYSIAKPFIEKALSLNHSKVYVLNIPYCVLDRKYSDCIGGHSTNVLDFDFNRSAARTKYYISKKNMYLPPCLNCSSKKMCEGVSKQYVKEYGKGEFNKI